MNEAERRKGGIDFSGFKPHSQISGYSIVVVDIESHLIDLEALVRSERYTEGCSQGGD